MNAQETTEPGIKDTDQIYNTDKLVNSFVSSDLKEKNHAEEKKQKENVFTIGDKNVNAFKLTVMVDQMHREKT